MTTIVILAFLAIMFILLFKQLHKTEEKKTIRPLNDQGNPMPEKLLDLDTTTLAERQRAYGRGFRLQQRYDILQRQAEAAGDTATLDAILNNNYTGPLPELTDDKPRVTIALGGGSSDAPIQELRYFCIKDKGYHTSVWPKNQGVGDCLEFPIAGIKYGEHIADHLGEFAATLEPDPANPYDPKAIKILTNEGHRVGYVPKDMTTEVRRFTALPCTCYCYIGISGSTYFSDCYITNFLQK